MKSKNKKLVLSVLAVFCSLLILITTYLSYIFSGPHYNSCGKKVPVEVRIEFQQEGIVVDCDFKIVEHNLYLLTLDFRINSDVSKIQDTRNIIFKKNVGKNVIIPIRSYAPLTFDYTITDTQSGVSFVKTADNLKETSFGTNSTHTNFSKIALLPGRYNIKIRNLKIAEELRHIESYMVIKYDLIK